jgi:hypothetical protein
MEVFSMILRMKLARVNPVIRAVVVTLALVAFVLLVSTPVFAAETWTASYWNNTTLSGPPTLQRAENNAPNYNWSNGGSPAPGIIQSQNFSAQWRTNMHLDPGRWRFDVTMDDGARLWVGDKLLINRWYSNNGGTFSAEIDIFNSGLQPVILEYFQTTGNAVIRLTWTRVDGNVSTTGPIKAEYFSNTSVAGQPVFVRYESTPLSNNWGMGSPAPGLIPVDNFSARYTYTVDTQPGRYRFNVQAQDGVRLWINGQLVVDRWGSSGLQQASVDIDLLGGIQHMIATYYNGVGPASISINAAQIGGSGGGTGGGGTAGLTATVDTSYLNMRSGPGVEFEVITVLSRGTQVVLTGQVSDYWVQAREPGGLVGWVSSSYLDYNNQNITNPAG